MFAVNPDRPKMPRLLALLAAVMAVPTAGVLLAQDSQTDAPSTRPAMPSTMPATAEAAPAAAPPAQSNRRTTDSGLTIVTESVPKEAVKAQPGDLVWVHYTGKLQNGAVFDSSLKRGADQPISFSLGARQVIKGWDEGIVGMVVGEKRQLIIPPDLAYGPAARPGIPANSTLIFDVELVGVYSAK